MADRETQPAGTAFLDLRPLLLSIAYRMLGSYSDAEDIVQEAFLRLHRATTGDGDVEYVKAFLITVTTRLAIDQLRSARASRETYAGPWLPEPVVDEYADLADEAALSDSCRRPSYSCSNGCRPSSGRCSCSATSSATPSMRSRRSS